MSDFFERILNKNLGEADVLHPPHPTPYEPYVDVAGPQEAEEAEFMSLAAVLPSPPPEVWPGSRVDVDDAAADMRLSPKPDRAVAYPQESPGDTHPLRPRQQFVPERPSVETEPPVMSFGPRPQFERHRRDDVPPSHAPAQDAQGPDFRPEGVLQPNQWTEEESRPLSPPPVTRLRPVHAGYENQILRNSAPSEPASALPRPARPDHKPLLSSSLLADSAPDQGEKTGPLRVTADPVRPLLDTALDTPGSAQSAGPIPDPLRPQPQNLPSVTVTIGRIEIRAAPAPERKRWAPLPLPVAPRIEPLGLDDYFREQK